MIQKFNNIGYGRMAEFKESLEIQTVDGYTPFILSCKYGHLEVAKYLHSVGCNIEAVWNQHQNGLHYAVINLDIEVIKYLVYCDSDTRRLRETVNWRNKKPQDLDHDHYFEALMLTIWDWAKLGVHEFKNILKQRYWNIDEQSHDKKNTPLHIATNVQNINIIK